MDSLLRIEKEVPQEQHRALFKAEFLKLPFFVDFTSHNNLQNTLQFQLVMDCSILRIQIDKVTCKEIIQKQSFTLEKLKIKKFRTPYKKEMMP